MYSSEKKALIGGTIMIVIVLGILFGRYYYQEHKEQQLRDIATENEKHLTSNKLDFPTISAQELETILKENSHELRVIDIRPQHSYEIKHLPDTINIPLNILTLRDVLLPAEQIIVLIDEGETSINDIPIFEEILDAGQEKRVVLLDGGFESWDIQTGRTISYGDPNSFIDHAKVTPVSKQDLQEKLSQETDLYTLIDVRTEKSFKENHIDGAINIPLPAIEEKVAIIPKGKIIIVYGKDELESFQAGVRLHDLGHLAVQMLQGGYENWTAPTEEQHLTEESSTTNDERIGENTTSQ